MKILPFLLLLILTGIGNVYSQDTISFSKEGVFTDARDGHVYKTIKLGDQVWMAENLAFLPTVSPSKSASTFNSLYYVYQYEGNDVNYAKTTEAYSAFGVFYNWPAAKKACPEGWHLPNDSDWKQLTDFLSNNGYDYGGEKGQNGKALASKEGWVASTMIGPRPYHIGSNLSENNSSGFNALPAGRRSDGGGFAPHGVIAFFWSATEKDNAVAYVWHLMTLNTCLVHDDKGQFEAIGNSVRCIKDK